jgi:hypothetical protein
MIMFLLLNVLCYSFWASGPLGSITIVSHLLFLWISSQFDDILRLMSNLKDPDYNQFNNFVFCFISFNNLDLCSDIFWYWVMDIQLRVKVTLKLQNWKLKTSVVKTNGRSWDAQQWKGSIFGSYNNTRLVMSIGLDSSYLGSLWQKNQNYWVIFQ